MGETGNQTNAAVRETKPPERDPATPKEKMKRVRVICEGTLGHLLLKKGDTTEDADYVGLLKTRRGKTMVQEV